MSDLKNDLENYTQLCVWPGTTVLPKTIEYFQEYMKENFNARVIYHCEVKTLPDIEDDKVVEGTGNRNDLFFYVHKDDIAHFALPRLEMGIRWWEDVILYNDNSKHLYSEQFINEHPTTW